MAQLGTQKIGHFLAQGNAWAFEAETLIAEVGGQSHAG